MGAKVLRFMMLTLLACLATWARADSITVVVDDIPLLIEKGTVELRDHRVFMPLRSLAEALGLMVHFDAETLLVEVEDTFRHEVGTSMIVAMPDETIFDIGAASYIKDGRTMVSLRLLSEALGAKVEWDGVQQMVLVQSKQQENMDSIEYDENASLAFKTYIAQHRITATDSSGDFLLIPTDLDDDGSRETVYVSGINAVHVLRYQADGSVCEVGQALQVGRSPVRAAQTVMMQGSEAKYVILTLSDSPQQNWFILTRLMDEQLSYIDTSRAMADEMDDYLIDSDGDGHFDGYISEHSGEDVLMLPTSFLFGWDVSSETFALVRMNIQLGEPSQTPEGVVYEYLVLRYLVQAFLDSEDKSPQIKERLKTLLHGDDSAFDATVLVDMRNAFLFPEEDADMCIDLECHESGEESSVQVTATFQHGDVCSAQSFSLQWNDENWTITEISQSQQLP